MSFFSELRRRNIDKVAFVYVIGAGLAYWITVVLQTQLDLPWWTTRLVAGLLLFGFPLALIFAWVYEFTPEGFKKAIEVDQTQSIVFKTGQKLNAALAVLVVLGAVAMIADRMMPELAVVEPAPVPESAYEQPSRPNTPPEIRSFTLPNGLRFIVWPDHDIPNVAFYNFVRAGSRNEYPGITGLSHFFEHMLFNGTSEHPPGEFDRLLEAAGARNNAYTSNDLTVYQDWFPKSALETVFALEADRLANLAFVPEVIQSERGVVVSERRQYVDYSNFGLLYERVRATAYLAHPYQFPIIGWPSDIASWTRSDLEAYYETYYAPNNLTIVVAGDIRPDEIYLLAETYFAELESSPPPPAVRTVEPGQSGLRRITVTAPAQTPLLHVAFHGGSATSPSTLTLELLLGVLVSGDSSRLHQRLVEDTGMAIAVDGFQLPGFDPGLVYFTMLLAPDTDPAEAEREFFDALATLAADGVTESELSKARSILLADYWRGLATIDGKAEALGDYAVLHGDYEKLFTRPDAIRSISAERLQDAARTVLESGNATVGLLVAPPEEAS